MENQGNSSHSSATPFSPRTGTFDVKPVGSISKNGGPQSFSPRPVDGPASPPRPMVARDRKPDIQINSPPSTSASHFEASAVRPPQEAASTQTSNSTVPSPSTADNLSPGNIRSPSTFATNGSSLHRHNATAGAERRRSSASSHADRVRHPRRPGDKVPEHVVNKWKLICTKARRRDRVRNILATFLQINGRPCPICQSMRLTEEKFMIKDFANHRRAGRAIIHEEEESITQDSRKLEATDFVAQDDMEFGPSGLMLGKITDIQGRSDRCRFCRLVIQSLQEQGVDLAETITIVDERDGQERVIPKWNSVCHASWQIDGRMLVRDLKTKEIIGQHASTRRIRLRWDDPDLEDSYVVLLASQTRGHQGLFLGQSLYTARVDAAKIRTWLELCVNHHGSRCHPQGFDYSNWKSFFGVIDVNNMMLTALPPGEKYVTLSYVWGKDTFFRTTKDNIQSLLGKESLRSKISEMPRTINDAISLVRQIGLQYLWIDALCIIQDSQRSWSLNSKVMDLVYGNSYLNICAADGPNAHAGLKGLDPDTPQPSQIIVQYDANVRLLCTTPAEGYIKRSIWNSRGWTFQERLLSPRNLIFVDGRIYFQCWTTARSGEIITDHPDAGWSLEFADSPSQFLNQLPSRPLAVYKKALELYMLRDLKYPKDILAAFNGIGNVICDAAGGKLVFGLPSSHFDWALLWEARDSPQRREDDGDEKFPSWSWCGWIGEMMEYKSHILHGCEDNLHEWLMNHTWIVWYIRDGNGNLVLVWDGTKTAQSNVNLRWRGYFRDDSVRDDPNYDPYGRFIEPENRDRPRSKSEDFKQILDECPFGVNIIETPRSANTESNTFSQNNPVKDMHYLQFFTWSAGFRLRETPPKDFRRKFQRYSILDYKDDWCGTIVLDRLKAPLDPDKIYDFIAISDAKEFHPDEYDGWAYYIPTEREHSTWDLYYVLLIEVKGNIAYRVGLGKVFKEAFDNTCNKEGKQWKEYILG